MLFAVAFTLSGFSALAYQIAWQRVLTQVVGSDAMSVVLVVSIFMIWLGVGAELARRLLPYLRRRAGLAYGILEIIVGLSGIVSIPILRAANAWLAGTGHDSLWFDVLLNLFVLAIPVIGMGMTTPFIVELAKNRLDDLGRTIGRFYGLNILGAAVGALATGLFLIELFGLFGITLIAASLNLIVGLIVFFAFQKIKSVERSFNALPDSNSKNSIKLEQFHLYVASGLFGFGTLSLQIIYFRIISNYFTLSVIVFPAILAAYLGLMSLGQILGGRLADRHPARLAEVAVALFAVGALLLLAALRFPPEWAASLGSLAFTSFNGQMVSEIYPNLVGDPNPLTVLLFSLVFMSAVLAWAALFPVMLRLMTQNVAEAGERFAAAYSLYTIGNVLGALASGLVFFDWLGTGGTAMATVCITGLGALAVILWSGPKKRSHKAWALGAAGLSVFAVMLMPLDYYRSFGIGRYQITDVFEGRTGVATVVPTGRFYSIIDINRTASASALVNEPGPEDQYEAWRWNHTELFALDASFRPREILIIGIGHAYLIDALLDLPFVERITVVEIAQEIVDAVRTHTLTGTRRIFSDPRVEIIIADGRRFVQKAKARGDKFDLIQTKINEPWHAGSGNLFTIEFFNSQKEILNDGGYLGVRPHVGHAVDGLSVFGEAIWPGYYHLFFKNGPITIPDEALITPDIADAWRRLIPGTAGSAGQREDILRVVRLPCCNVGANVAHNTDDRPRFEYDWLNRSFGFSASPRTTLWSLDLPMESVRVVEVE
ncbi:MAG: hypothetical protein MEP57_04290 [Microvirga sp.]|nr:hypothetical protein [Microvirga sp.]